MLEVRGLRKSYGGTVALGGVDLDVTPGEVVGLLGPNGAGKTTLVSIVAGLRRADGGSVSVCGVDALARPVEARRHLGIAPQDLGVYPTLRVAENLRLFADLSGVAARERQQRVDEVSAVFSLGGLLDRQAQFLSGGEKRRLHSAMAMLHRPPVLLLDEPTTGVDVSTRRDVLDAVRRLAADGTAVCYSTHYLAEVETLGASVAILDRGRMIARGRLADLVARHGGTAVELQFAGAPPLLAWDGPTERVDEVLRLFTERPEADVARALALLGDGASTLRGVEIVRPSLESVFLALTGRRFDEEGTEVADVVAS